MKYIILLYFLMIVSVAVKAQNDQKGTIKGRIYNTNNNEAVAYATVLVYGTQMATMTDENGNYALTGIKPGFVRLRVSSVGYKNYLSEEVMITNARAIYLDLGIEENAVQLNEVVIKGNSMMRKEESPLSLRTIGIAEIEKSPGSNRDISKILQTLPGVSATPAYRNDLIVRGGGSSENRFYLDDIEIPNLNHFSTQGASGGSIGTINADFLREVNFYSSAFPANRGNALSSVIEIKQIDGNRERLKVKGSVGATDMALTLDGPINKNSTFIFSARRSYLQLLFSALQLPFLPTYNDMELKVKVKLNNKNLLTFLGLGSIDMSKLNLNANKTEEQRYILGYLPVDEQMSYTVGAVYKHFGAKSFQTIVLSRNFLNNLSYKYRDNIEVDSLKNYDYASNEGETKLRIENDQKVSFGAKLNYGVSLEYAHYHNSTFLRSFNKNMPDIINYHSDLDVLKYGFFFQATQSVFNNTLSISPGLRADANNYTAPMSNPLNQFSPHLALSFAVTKNFFINANVGNYHQLPPYTTLGYRNAAGELVNKTNDVTYMSVDHFVGGIEYHPQENSKFTLEGFYKSYSHYPYSVKDSVAIASKGADYGTFGDEEVRSISKGRSFGLEVFYQNSDLKGTNIILSYTLVRSEFQNSHGIYIPTAWDNKHLLNVTATRSLPRNWKAGFKWRFVGGAPYTPYDYATSSIKEAWDAQGRAYLDYSRYNALRLRSFHQLDLRVDKEYFFNKWTLNFYLDVQNVYNFKAQQPDYLAINESNPNRDATHYNLKYISGESGTILPTIGVIVEF